MKIHYYRCKSFIVIVSLLFYLYCFYLYTERYLRIFAEPLHVYERDTLSCPSWTSLCHLSDARKSSLYWRGVDHFYFLSWADSNGAFPVLEYKRFTKKEVAAVCEVSYIHSNGQHKSCISGN